jgi:hypothetical protein
VEPDVKSAVLFDSLSPAPAEVLAIRPKAPTNYASAETSGMTSVRDSGRPRAGALECYLQPRPAVTSRIAEAPHPAWPEEESREQEDEEDDEEDVGTVAAG